LEEFRKARGLIDDALTENDKVIRFRCEPRKRVPSDFWDDLLSAIKVGSDECHVPMGKTGRASNL